MRITDLLKKQGIMLNAQVHSKQEAYRVLIELHSKAGNITDKEEYEKGIWAREALSSTAIGEGIAIPHAKNKAVKNAGLTAITIPDGIECEALDGAPSRLFFMIAVPESGNDLHLQVLSKLSTILLMKRNKRNLEKNQHLHFLKKDIEY